MRGALFFIKTRPFLPNSEPSEFEYLQRKQFPLAKHGKTRTIRIEPLNLFNQHSANRGAASTLCQDNAQWLLAASFQTDHLRSIQPMQNTMTVVRLATGIPDA